MPLPKAVGRAIWVPFQVSDRPLSEQGRPVVADAIHFVPRTRLADFSEALKSALKAKPSEWEKMSGEHLHLLCDWIDTVRYFVPSMHNANSQREWNPVYSIVGRKEGKPSPAHLLNPKFRGQPC